MAHQPLLLLLLRVMSYLYPEVLQAALPLEVLLRSHGISLDYEGNQRLPVRTLLPHPVRQHL